MVLIKQAKLLVLMISLLVFAGCAASTKLEGRYIEWREEFVLGLDHEIMADITFSSGDKVFDYTLSYIKSNNDETVEVIAPEQISKIKAHIVGEESDISFEGSVLETGSGILNGLSPMTTLPTFMDFIEGGHVENFRKETNDEGLKLIVTELELADGSKMTLWQTEQGMTPISATIRNSDTLEAKIQITEIK